MNRIINILFIFVFCINVNLFSQNPVNQTDSKGLKTGYWIHYSSDEKTKLEEGTYVDDKKDGAWKAYFPDGKIKHEITYNKGKAIGYVKMYYANGTLREEGTWKETCWVGNYRYYYPNGQAAYVWHYNNQGKREGEQKYFYENGNLKFKGVWDNGKVKTNVEVYDSEGLMVQNRIYENGTFAETVKIETPVKDSTKNTEKPHSSFTGTGYNTIYRLDMQIDQKGYFEKGKLIKGESYVYDENGVLIETKIFEKGEIVKVKPANNPVNN